MGIKRHNKILQITICWLEYYAWTMTLRDLEISLFYVLTWCTNYSISVGKNNRYGHPIKEVLEKLEKSKIYRTDQYGSIIFKINSNKLKIKTYTP